tara:strand:- start:1137 stop:1373 length:237 start_codon:yes stop_codon:yes gene_type:complete
VKDFLFRFLYFIIIFFLIYESYSLNNEILELKETIYIQDRAIKIQNLLLDYKKPQNLIETNDNEFYNPLNPNSKKLSI